MDTETITIMASVMTMIDIHCHLLFNVDDGAKTLDNSIRVLRNLDSIGYTDIILTPHYIKDSNYISNKKNNLKVLKDLKEEAKKEKININLYLGNEIFIDDDIINLLKKNEITSLNGTDYLLIELPMSGEYAGYEEIFKDLIDHGKKVILAHPERYLSFQKDFNKILELERMGVLFQSNIESITGIYGKKASVLVKKLLKLKKITYLATDIHHNKRDYKSYDIAFKKILKYISFGELEKLVNTNAQNLIK